MRNWKAIAQAHGLPLSADDLDRVTRPLEALEEIFRPLADRLTPDLEPDLALRLGDDE